MRLIIDMNLSPRWVGALEAAGFEAWHWSTLGPHGAVVAALRQLTSELEAGALVTIDTGRTRLRILPLQPNRPC